MSATPDVTGGAIVQGAAARPPAAPARAEARALAGRITGQRGNEWLARAAWTVGRTGRPGLVGIAILLAAAVFLASTHRQVLAEVEALRAEVAAAQRPARTATTDEVPDADAVTRALPARTDMPAILDQLFEQAARAHLSIDTARYEIGAMRGGAAVRHQVAFPVTGPYPQIRAFIDATLAAMPEVALTDLSFARKTIGDGDVEAQIRMTIYTRSAP
jgi:Tfp pilus assembly protein PilO